MSLVHKHHIHAELFKGQKVILLFLGRQFFQFGFQVAPENRHLFDTPVFTLFILHFADCCLNLIDLLLQQHDLPLSGDRDFLKLAVRQNHRVIFPGGDFGNIAVPVFWSEVLHCGHQQIGVGEEAVKLGRPLTHKGIRDHIHRLVDRPQVLQVHPRSNQGGGLAGAHLMSRKSCAGVNDTGNKVKLVFPQLHLGVHAGYY